MKEVSGEILANRLGAICSVLRLAQETDDGVECFFCRFGRAFIETPHEFWPKAFALLEKVGLADRIKSYLRDREAAAEKGSLGKHGMCRAYDGHDLLTFLQNTACRL